MLRVTRAVLEKMTARTSENMEIHWTGQDASTTGKTCIMQLTKRRPLTGGGAGAEIAIN